MNLMLPIASLALLGGLVACARTGKPEDVPSTILALERAALDLSDRGDASEFLRLSDPDVVYMDPFLDAPIHGIEALRAHYTGFKAAEPGRGEMSNQKVDVFGDTAVLTFNYKTEAHRRNGHGWNATEVYRHTHDGWRIVHTHWSIIKPRIQE